MAFPEFGDGDRMVNWCGAYRVPSPIHFMPPHLGLAYAQRVYRSCPCYAIQLLACQAPLVERNASFRANSLRHPLSAMAHLGFHADVGLLLLFALTHISMVRHSSNVDGHGPS